MKNKKKIDVYADNNTSKYLKNSFKYCFEDKIYYPSTLKLNQLKNKHIYKFKKEKIIIENFPVEHGNIKSTLYIINKSCAYASDVSKIFKKDIKKIKGIKFFILDCLRFNQHHSHFNLEEVFNLIDIIKPKKTILTNMTSDIDYLEIKKILPKNVVPAYDGMNFLI